MPRDKARRARVATMPFRQQDGTSGQVGTGAPNPPATALAPAVSETLAAGSSAIAVRVLTIAAGRTLTLGLGSIFRIL